MVADRTETRWGKFRPWVLWTAVPYGVMAVLTFTTRNVSASGKLAYAYATAVVFFVITFATTKERIRPALNQQSTVAQDVGDLTRNRPWLAMFALTLVLFVTLALRGGVMLYYVKYLVGREDLFSLFNGLGTASTIVGVLLSRSLAVRLGKRNLFIYGLFATAACTAVFALLPATAIAPIVVAEVVWQFAYGFTTPLLWAMMGDVADYSEWKNHRRATGVVFSAIVFALKAGLGVGGAIGGYVLSAYGYVPNVAQSARALDGIRLSVSLFLACGFLVSGLCLLFYQIDRETESQMSGELASRREQFTHTPVSVTP